jgi:hypothetical protein
MLGKQAKILSPLDFADPLVFAACTRHPIRNRVIVLLSAKAGLRAGEIANLTWEMVIDAGGEIGNVIELRDNAAKKGSGRLIPMHPDLADGLSAWRQISTGSWHVVRSERGGPMTREKGAPMWRALGAAGKGCLYIVSGRPSDAIETIISGIAAWRSTGASVWMPFFLLNLAEGYAKLGRFEDASRSIAEAVTTMNSTQEVWCEAEVNRVAGEIALLSCGTKAQTYYERALAIARQQQAKSWELRAAMSMARLWRDQGKRDEARDLLAPVYGWFTEGFETRDLKEARALLEELAS